MTKLKIGDIVTFSHVRPSHWNKQGKMDSYLGKTVTLTNIYDFPNGLQRLFFQGSGNWMFLSTDLVNSSTSIFDIGCVIRLRKPFKVFRKYPNNEFDVCDEDGNCIKVKENEIYLSQLNNKQTMKAMKDAVLATAKSLLKANNTVTTLEIKTELRRDYPYYYWDQSTVSKYMADLAGDGVFNYKDNGTHRIYSLPKTTKSVIKSKVVLTKTTVGTPKKNKLSASAAMSLLGNTGFQKAEFKNGRVITLPEIKSQKKSASGYLVPKMHNVAKITVSGKTYEII